MGPTSHCHTERGCHDPFHGGQLDGVYWYISIHFVRISNGFRFWERGYAFGGPPHAEADGKKCEHKSGIFTGWNVRVEDQSLALLGCLMHFEIPCLIRNRLCFCSGFVLSFNVVEVEGCILGKRDNYNKNNIENFQVCILFRKFYDN